MLQRRGLGGCMGARYQIALYESPFHAASATLAFAQVLAAALPFAISIK
jgi:hypothetical protein